jgi:hypothetical protein
MVGQYFMNRAEEQTQQYTIGVASAILVLMLTPFGFIQVAIQSPANLDYTV